MLVRFGVEDLGEAWPESVVCIGTFDGVHLGHQEVIGRAVQLASKKELPSVVVTFDRHPMALLAPEKCPPMVGSLRINLEQLERLGVSMAVVLKFDRELASTTAEDFLTKVLKGGLRASEAVIGHDFAFGKDRQGTPQWLAERIETEIVPPFELNDERVSSSRIRDAIQEGRITEANRYLGRPWRLEGIVVPGQRLGRTLGYPTINLAQPGSQATPKDGVYTGYADTDLGRFKAAISIGVRPGIGDGKRTIEAFLIDYPGESLYGKAVLLGFTARLRNEMAFGDLEGLKQQIAKDVAEAAKQE